MRHRPPLVWVCLVLLGVIPAALQNSLGRAERIADGVLLYRLHDPALLSPAAPVAVQALRLDPRKVALEIARGPGKEAARETVEALAGERPGAIAGINAGFFSLKTGRPTDFLKIGGEVVNGTARARGAVGILDRRGVTTLVFDRVVVSTHDGRPAYKPILDTSPEVWAEAQDAISGAGLLILDGRELKDWTDEVIATAFDTTRHPRTLIGVDEEGNIWLVTVDGRNPAISVGMTFTELQRLSKRLGLRSALNLDGGGSTTMWVDGRIVNHPSDAEGPRKVSDAILVFAR